LPLLGKGEEREVWEKGPHDGLKMGPAIGKRTMSQRNKSVAWLSEREKAIFRKECNLGVGQKGGVGEKSLLWSWYQTKAQTEEFLDKAPKKGESG